MTFDLGIENGEVVRGSGRRRLNLYVTQGRISAISDERRPARRTRDADGLLVLPGMVDTHVHLMDPADTSREDFPTGTLAAANAGVTTIVEHTHAAPVREPAELQEKLAYLAGRSRVDYGLAAHAWPDRIDVVGSLWRRGVAFFKAFTCTTHGLPGFDAGALRALFREVAAAGAVCLVHCEDEAITERLGAELRASGREDPGVIPEWRHPDAELVALSVVARLALITGARVVTAHVSSPPAAAIVAETSRSAPIVAESCPQYLTLQADEILREGALRKFTPPARARSAIDLDAMWQAAADDRIHHIATDHAPSTREQKQSGSIWDVHFGLPGLDTTLPILLDAAARGAISYERAVQLYAEAPARVYGLAPRKGRIEVGSDADLVLVDPEMRWTITPLEIRSKAGWSPFEGRSIQGRAIETYLRGELIAERGSVVEPGFGRFVPGAGLSR
jgi:dihydroorotase (multifunctional complex type)